MSLSLGTPVLMDPMRSRVLLIGASRFDASSGLRSLPSVPAGIVELRRVLTDPGRGGLPAVSCHALVDPMTTREVADAIARCVEEAEHTLLIYFSGHGLQDPHDRSLHLAVGGTDPKRPHSTAIPIDWIRHGLIDTAAVAKIVVLDCCFAGLATTGTLSASDLAAEVDVAGSYVMAAAPANRLALAPEGEEFTAFTGALLGVLRDGVPGGPERLDLDTVYRRLRRDLAARGCPAPQVLRSNDAARIALVRNAAYVAPDLDEEAPMGAGTARRARTVFLEPEALPPPRRRLRRPSSTAGERGGTSGSSHVAGEVHRGRGRQIRRHRARCLTAILTFCVLALMLIDDPPGSPTTPPGTSAISDPERSQILIRAQNQVATALARAQQRAESRYEESIKPPPPPPATSGSPAPPQVGPPAPF